MRIHFIGIGGIGLSALANFLGKWWDIRIRWVPDI